MISRFRTYFLWFALTILHTWLFYNQSLGSNALIFSVVMVLAVTWYHELQRKKMWWVAAGIHLLASVAVFWHGTFMPVALYHFSAFSLAGFVYTVQSSLPIAFMNGIAGSLAGFYVWILIRQNTWILYFTLTFYTLVDWDRFITWYNPNYAQALDLEYMKELGNTKLPYLKELIENNDSRVKDQEEEFQDMIRQANIPQEDWRSQNLDDRWLLLKLNR